MTTALERGEGSASRPGRSLPPGKTRYPLYRRLGGPQGPSGQVRKISPPTGIQPPDRPARSQSLYRLSYPAHAGTSDIRLNSRREFEGYSKKEFWTLPFISVWGEGGQKEKKLWQARVSSVCCWEELLLMRPPGKRFYFPTFPSHLKNETNPAFRICIFILDEVTDNAQNISVW